MDLILRIFFIGSTMQSNIGRKSAGKCLGNIANEPCKINKKILNVNPLLLQDPIKNRGRRLAKRTTVPRYHRVFEFFFKKKKLKKHTHTHTHLC